MPRIKVVSFKQTFKNIFFVPKSDMSKVLLADVDLYQKLKTET